MDGLLGRTFKVLSWVMFGKLSDDEKKKIVSFLEVAKAEAKKVEISANKKGELSLRYRKEF